LRSGDRFLCLYGVPIFVEDAGRDVLADGDCGIKLADGAKLRYLCIPKHYFFELYVTAQSPISLIVNTTFHLKLKRFSREVKG
jgi:hypothetical protein